MPSLATYINGFSNVRVLVIGDLILDQFTYGKVERISPEAPVPVFKVTHEKKMLGGAGNVVANLCALGCRVSLIGVVGYDANGEKISDLLHECGARSYLLRVQSYPTIVKTRLIAGGSHMSRVDREEVAPVLTGLMERYAKMLCRVVKHADIVLISDYNKGLLTAETTPMVIDVCRKFGKPVIVDPKGTDYSKYAGATLVKPNLKEFTEVAGHGSYRPTEPDFVERLKAGALELIHRFRLSNLLVTLGEHGMALLSADAPDHLLQLPTQAREVFDVSGAGDTSLATLGAALGCGVPICEAMQLANLASGIVVGKLGTATVTTDELREALTPRLPAVSNDIFEPTRKVLTLDQLEAKLQPLRKQGKVIGFTNGAFDCCHLGHLTSFIGARRLCDVLVVAVNSDASVKRYKGESRPIQDEKTRSLLLASMEFIDYVIVFDEDTPMHIIDRLRPDVLAKEGYTIDRWPEAQFARTYGAKIVTLPRVDGYSTSNLVRKMMQ